MLQQPPHTENRNKGRGNPSAAQPATYAVAASGFHEVPVHLVEPSPYQPRKDIHAEQLQELAESIRAEGLLQPIVVRKVGEKPLSLARFLLFSALFVAVRRVRKMEVAMGKVPLNRLCR